MSPTPVSGSLPDDALLAASAEALKRSALGVDATQLEGALSELDDRLEKCRASAHPSARVGQAEAHAQKQRPLRNSATHAEHGGRYMFNRSTAPGWFGFSRTTWYTTCGFGLSMLLIVGGWRAFARNGLLGWNGSHAPTMTTYVTRNGQRAEIRLPDGSAVVLNVASRLDVPTNFAAGNRVLQLTGEALFTVGHRENTPFTVVSGPAVVRVLGTRFVVRRYATDAATTVAVGDGKVAVHSVVLTERQQVTIGARGVGPIQAANMAQFGFAAGVLTIEDMPLADAVLELNRWYDADIRVDDPRLAARRINGKFAPGSLTDLKSILDLMLDARVVRVGRTLTISHL